MGLPPIAVVPLGLDPVSVLGLGLEEGEGVQASGQVSGMVS